MRNRNLYKIESITDNNLKYVAYVVAYSFQEAIYEALTTEDGIINISLLEKNPHIQEIKELEDETER